MRFPKRELARGTKSTRLRILAMKIHEYQAKQLLQAYGVPVERGIAIFDRKEISTAMKTLGPCDSYVAKAQVHAGGRGKGKLRSGNGSGIQCHSDAKKIEECVANMLGNRLITAQTGAGGRPIHAVYLCEGKSIQREYYLAILVDRAAKKPVIVASAEGGMDIEMLAKNAPEKIFREYVTPSFGLQPFQIRKIAFALGIDNDEARKQFSQLLRNLYRFFWEKNASLVEINPLVQTTCEQFIALDAKLDFDDNGLLLHPDIAALRDEREEDPNEMRARKFGMNYIPLEGNIACLVNGAGLAMATMDIIQYHGGSPANFLDAGGNAQEEQICEALQIFLNHPRVKGILINIFGGIMRCDAVAQGILCAVGKIKPQVPLVVRLEGTNAAEGRAILAASGLKIIAAETLADGAEKIVSLVKNSA